MFFLDHRTAYREGTAGRDLWLNSAQEGWDNEPDFVDAMGMEFEDWTDGWLEFVITRAAVGTESTPVWGSRYSDPKFGVRVEETIDYAELPVTVTPEFQPIQTGVVYRAISGVPRGEEIRIDADGDPSVTWAVVSQESGYGGWQESGRLDHESKGGEIIVGAVNLGSSGFDADELIQPAGVSVEIWVADAAPEGADDEKTGGCAVTPRSPSGWAWLAGLLFLGFRRKP